MSKPQDHKWVLATQKTSHRKEQCAGIFWFTHYENWVSIRQILFRKNGFATKPNQPHQRVAAVTGEPLPGDFATGVTNARRAQVLRSVVVAVVQEWNTCSRVGAGKTGSSKRLALPPLVSRQRCAGRYLNYIQVKIIFQGSRAFRKVAQIPSSGYIQG